MSTGVPRVGAVISTGSFVQTLGTDRSGSIWVSAPSFSDTAVEPNGVYVIAKGASTATAVAGLSFLGGTVPVLSGKLSPYVHVLTCLLV